MIAGSPWSRAGEAWVLASFTADLRQFTRALRFQVGEGLQGLMEITSWV